MRRFPEIKQPCPKQWDELQGNDPQKRFCTQCQHHVHNLSACSEAEVKAILSRPGRKCVSYRLPVPPPTSRHGSRTVWPLRALASVFLALLAACGTTYRSTTTGYIPDAIEEPAAKPGSSTKNPNAPWSDSDGKLILGGIPHIEDPLWRRILFFWQYR